MNLAPNSLRSDLEERPQSNRQAQHVSSTPAALATNGDDTGDRLCEGAWLVEVDSALRVLEDKRLQLLVKRQFDVWGALLAILVLSPICLITAVLIRITSSGPAVFKQLRIGRDQKPFVMYKFRTMRVDPDCSWLAAQEAAAGRGLLLKAVRDPRVTRVGGILRATSLDELPQLFNVLKGDMSLVGPRPLLPFMLSPHPRFSKARSLIRPGITGLWQIRDRENNTSAAAMMPHDLEYLRQFNLLLDLSILLRTVVAVLSRRGAC